MQAYRYCWGPQRTRVFNFQWDAIHFNSFVVVTASEGREGIDEQDHVIAVTSTSPQRFVGNARFTVDNIAPHDGGVTFRVTIDWDPHELLMLWTDIIVFDDIRYGTGYASLG